MPNSPTLQKLDALFEQELNAQQRLAVEKPRNEAVKVMAGAGTGKTKLISYRFLKLVAEMQAENIERPQERILAVTFTKEAANSLFEKINLQLVNNGFEGLTPQCWIGNFHQIAIRILRSNLGTAPIPWALYEENLSPDFDILDGFSQRLLFNRVWQAILNNDHADIKPVLARYGLNNDISPDVLSAAGFQRLSDLGLEDINGVLSAETLLPLINRIKTSGLSPREFFDVATQQTTALSEFLTRGIDGLSVPQGKESRDDKNRRAIDCVAHWEKFFAPYASPDWKPTEHVVDTASAGDNLDTVKFLKAFYLEKGSFIPTRDNFPQLQAETEIERALIHTLAATYAVFQHALYKANACDFDDLINHAILLLENQPALREAYQQQFEAIIVDEFQDSNGSQLKLLKLLMRPGNGGHPNITVVGDLKQSIYKFRFAQPENMDLILQDGARTLPHHPVPLQTNYRCRPNIIAAANIVTGNITDNASEQLQVWDKLEKHTTPQITWVNLGMDDTDRMPDQKAREAEAIARAIVQLAGEENYRYEQIAVLANSNPRLEELQQALTRYNIPAVRKKNPGFFQENAVKDAIALLKLMLNPHDDLALARILQSRLSQKHLRVIANAVKALNPDGKIKKDAPHISWFSYLKSCQAGEHELALPSPVKEGVFDLIDILSQARARQARTQTPQLFLWLANNVGLVQHHWPEHLKVQTRNTLRQFEKLLFKICEKKPLQPTLSEIVSTLQTYQNEKKPELPFIDNTAGGENAVQLMTIHSAKGLEFRAVLIAETRTARQPPDKSPLLFDPQFEGRPGFGLMLANFRGEPTLKKELYKRAWENPRETAEAQRVFYVALTRAMEKLFVFRGRASRGQGSADWTDPAHYPGDCLEVINEALTGQSILETHFTSTQVMPSTRETTPIITPNTEAHTTKPDPALTHGLRLSFSALNTYERCPALYWLRYQWCLPEPPSKESTRHATLTGSYLHGLIHRHYLLEGKLPDELARAIVSDWLDAEATRLAAGEKDRIVGEALSLYGAFTQSEYAYGTLIKNGYEIYPEQKIRFPWHLKNTDVMIEVDGVMDLLLKDTKTGEHTLIDFKTNTTLNEKQRAHYFEQLLLYRHGLAILWPTMALPDANLKLVHVTPKKLDTWLYPGGQSAEKLETLIPETAKTAQQQVFPARGKQTDCRKPHPCPYLEICPEAR